MLFAPNLGVALAAMILIIWLWFSLYVVKEWERGVVLRLGRMMPTPKAAVLQKQPTAIQLRYLQTLTEIGVEKNTTVVFPLPIDLVQAWMRGQEPK